MPVDIGLNDDARNTSADALRVLCTLGERLGPLFLVFEPLVRPALKRAPRDTPRGATEHRRFPSMHTRPSGTGMGNFGWPENGWMRTSVKIPFDSI